MVRDVGTTHAYPQGVRIRFATAAAAPIALLLAALSLGGLVLPVYAHETPAWTAQAIGQDWFDLVIAAPWIAICATRRGYRWRVLLAGAYAYTVYELFIYAFAVHFNALFLVYCATLGLAGYALVAQVIELAHGEQRAPRFVGGYLVAIGVAFALLWLAEDVPALLHRTTPASLVETGLLTNPVHVIDLAFVLPAHVIAGILVWKRRNALFAQIVLAFGILMAASIGAMLVVMQGIGGVAIAMFVIAAVTAVVLARALR